jgi:serine/threonine-protein kinase RsbW
MTDHTWTLQLDVPASTRFLHVVRLTTAGAAAEAGLDTAEIEDVKIAIDELCSVAMHGKEDQLNLVFEAQHGELVVKGSLPPGPELVVDDLCHAILSATVDDVSLTGDDHGRWFEVTKSHRGS